MNLSWFLAIAIGLVFLTLATLVTAPRWRIAAVILGASGLVH